MSNRKELNAIFKKYGLIREQHVFFSDDYTIITRQGIQKIQKAEGIQIKFELVHCASKEAVIKATGYFEGVEYQTHGEASPYNNTFTFSVAIAEKRALSRLILMMVMKDFEGIVMGKDELDTQPKSVKKTVTEKGTEAEDSVLKLMKGIKK